MADAKEQGSKADPAFKESVGTTYESSEPEFMGRVPVRQELEVIPNDPDRPKIGWVCQEYVGYEVYRYTHNRVWTKATLTRREDLKPGDQIATVSLWGGYLLLTVAKDNDGRLYGDSENTIGMLEFDRDDRHCWVCTGHINKRGIARVSKSSVEE